MDTQNPKPKPWTHDHVGSKKWNKKGICTWGREKRTKALSNNILVQQHLFTAKGPCVAICHCSLPAIYWILFAFRNPCIVPPAISCHRLHHKLFKRKRIRCNSTCQKGTTWPHTNKADNGIWCAIILPRTPALWRSRKLLAKPTLHFYLQTVLQLQSLAHHRICECVLPIEIVQSRGIGRVRQPVIGITPLEAMRCSCKRSLGSHRSNRDAERVTQTCSGGSITVPARTSKQSAAAWKEIPGYVPWATREEQRRQYSRKLRHGYNIFQSRTCKFMHIKKKT